MDFKFKIEEEEKYITNQTKIFIVSENLCKYWKKREKKANKGINYEDKKNREIKQIKAKKIFSILWKRKSVSKKKTLNYVNTEDKKEQEDIV